MNTGFDVIVVGLGAMGTAACAHLAARGVRVLGLDPHPVGHGRGSSGGGTRLFRTAYYEHPDYVPLLRRARAHWHALEAATGETLFVRTGLVFFGPEDASLLRDTRRAADLHKVPVDTLAPADAQARFPTFRLPDAYAAVFEPDAGVLHSQRANRAHATVARRQGAALRTERLTRWKEEGQGVTVETEQGRYQAGHLVMAAGAWTGKLLPGLAQRLTVTRQTARWVAPPDPAPFRAHTFPAWAMADDGGGFYYGMPLLPTAEPTGLKIARHHPGLATDPDAVARALTPTDRTDLQHGLRTYLPTADGPETAAHVCLYTLSPDNHFVLGRLPGHAYVSVAAGFSGHGFKFAPVIGEALADLATEGTTALPIGFLAPDRFGS